MKNSFDYETHESLGMIRLYYAQTTRGDMIMKNKKTPITFLAQATRQISIFD